MEIRNFKEYTKPAKVNPVEVEDILTEKPRQNWDTGKDYVVMPKLSWWQKVWMRFKVWIEKVILKFKRRK